VCQHAAYAVRSKHAAEQRTIHKLLDARQLLRGGRHRGVEVETQPVKIHERASLRDVIADDLLQSGLQQVRCSVVAARLRAARAPNENAVRALRCASANERAHRLKTVCRVSYPAAKRRVDGGGDACANRKLAAALHFAGVQEQAAAACFLHIRDAHRQLPRLASKGQHAAVSNLTARLGVERAAVQHQLHLLARKCAGCRLAVHDERNNLRLR
jgi:hypothetical protein